MTYFSTHILSARKRLLETDKNFSLRRVASRIGVEPSHLSKMERGEVPPSDRMIEALALELQEDRDVLYCLAGKVPEELRAAISKRPQLFAELFSKLKDAPDHALLRLVREVRDGNW